MKLPRVAKPSTSLLLSPTLRLRTRYAALMMLGIGMMLFAVAGSVSRDQAAAVGGWSVGFFVLSLVLLAVIGVAAVREQLVGVPASDIQNESAVENSKDTPNTPEDNDLSEAERGLITLLRSNDIPPDVFAESLRQVLERRMGR